MNGNCYYGRAYLRSYCRCGQWFAPFNVGWFSHADHADFDITGAETYIRPANLKCIGLTVGIWWNNDHYLAQRGLIGKWNDNGVNQRSYELYVTAGDVLQFRISTDGINVVSVNSSVNIADLDDDWCLVVGRFVPSETIDIYVTSEDLHGMTKDTNNVGSPATIFNSTAQVNVGARCNGAQDYANFHVCDGFICAENLTDAEIRSLYDQQYAMMLV